MRCHVLLFAAALSGPLTCSADTADIIEKPV